VGGSITVSELFLTERGPGIMVLASSNNGVNDFTAAADPRIDGFSITGGISGGAIMVNGYADFLDISNNRANSNAGIFGGGIRVGHPATVAIFNYSNASNDNLFIHHNQVVQNGALEGGGGGISLYTGSHDYRLTDNYICGNFARGNGGGINHAGLSRNGLIQDNTIIFNSSFKQGQSVSGGGIHIGGLPALLLSPRSEGSGSVTINANLIHGNLAGAGNGGGINASMVNGQDVVGETPDAWYRLDIFNNFITNNVAGLTGGGLALQDVASVRIQHNTIANNDNTSTAGAAFTPGSPDASTTQPGAGIVSYQHSNSLNNVVGGAGGIFGSSFSNPDLVNNIIWHNRTFSWERQTPEIYGLLPDIGNGDSPAYDDLAVLPSGAGSLNPLYSILTDSTAYDVSNSTDDPLLLNAVPNGGGGGTGIGTTIPTAAAFDEGGNFIDVRFAPLSLVDTLTGDPIGNSDGTVLYDDHLSPTSPAIGSAIAIAAADGNDELALDIDGDDRSAEVDLDIGADQYVAPPDSPSGDDLIFKDSFD
jgi:hypothetical protein